MYDDWDDEDDCRRRNWWWEALRSHPVVTVVGTVVAVGLLVLVLGKLGASPGPGSTPGSTTRYVHYHHHHCTCRH